MQKSENRVDAIRLLITMPWGIGDAIEVGLSAVDQMKCNDPVGNAEIDLLCNQFQTEILEEDPCIHRLIEVDKRLFPTNEAETWKRGIFLMPAEPKHPLLVLAALIDQSDIFITGDTGTMHLAAAAKKIKQPTYGELKPRNSVKIITLYGGTNPSIHGYPRRAIILGRGRKEQARIIPGVAKDMYHPNGKNLFDHIAPQQLTDAILSQ